MNVYMLSENYGNKDANMKLLYTAVRFDYTESATNSCLLFN